MSKSNIEHIRHSLAHLLAAAVLELWPDTKPTIGPAISDGFYYDFQFTKPISDSDLPKIEKKMSAILPSWNKFTAEKTGKKKALALYKNNPFKKELIQEIAQKGEDVTLYTAGKFTDLCRGGHAENPAKEIKSGSFKLTHIAGAYWRGDEKNSMLTRIYGAAFASKKELDNYLRVQEEAKKRDHKKLGPSLKLFMFHETSPGMPYWLPKGVALYNELINFWRREHLKHDYREIVSPLLNKKELYVISGHYEHYWEDMFVMKTKDGEEYGVKAMNCPNAMVVFGSEGHSYKDLPLRLSDTDHLHRNERSGTLNGLLRVREFRQDDAHIFITEDQISKEYELLFKLVERFYSIFELDYSFRLGTRPVNFMGDKNTWEKAEKTLEKILKASKKKFTIAKGDGAFYGPKIDILMRDALGREWQMGTLQLDFQQPRRFQLRYTDPNGKPQTPVVIHRVIYGSLERFIGILIEHFAGAFPLWLAPVQVAVLPISDELNEYAREVAASFSPPREGEMKRGLTSPNPSSRGGVSLRVEVDARSESIGKKIREAESQKIPYMLIVGKKEKENKTVSVRGRGEKDLGEMKLDVFAAKVAKEIAAKNLQQVTYN